ncbi:hypothetical protein EI94DRAFT_1799124 [Lactarius quietus]|nr:hypothetical protein EI94DRAFT_1799124 [Lactarius quietus]
MVSGTILVTGAIIALASRVSGHACIWTPSMWGFNKSDVYRPQDPMINQTFDNWCTVILNTHRTKGREQLPVGGTHNFQISCDKDATTYWPSGPGGDQRDPSNPNYPCPGQPTTEFHTNGINDLGGCALAVAYKSDVSEVQPTDFTIFSVNHTCVWYLNTYFEIPADMPVCPEGGCICAWFWIHKDDSGSEQNYMNGFQCNMTGATSTAPLPPAQIARRCGEDTEWGVPADPANCTYGPKQPLYWYQAERNNMCEDTYHTPLYNSLYNFQDGAQLDIFEPGNSSTNPNFQPADFICGGSYTPSSTPQASSLVSSSTPPASSPAGGNMSPSDTPPTPSTSSPNSYSPSSLPPMSSSPPAGGDANPSDTQPTPSMSSPDSQSSPPPAGGYMSPSDTPPTPSTPPSLSNSDPSQLSQPPQSPPPAPSPTDTTDPEYTSTSKRPKCSHDPNQPKPSGVYRRGESPRQDHAPRANTPAQRDLSSHDDVPARRVWGHRRRNVDRRNI